MSSRWLCWTVMLGLVGGCSFAVQEQADRMVCELPNHPLDLEQLAPADQSTSHTEASDQTTKAPDGDGLKPAGLQVTSQDQPKSKFEERLKYPAELPGAGAPPITIPGPDAPREQREKAIDLRPFYFSACSLADFLTTTNRGRGGEPRRRRHGPLCCEQESFSLIIELHAGSPLAPTPLWRSRLPAV